jgi:hypothetical protein
MKGAKAGHYLSGAITYIKTNDKKSVVRLPKYTTFIDLAPTCNTIAI